MNKHLSENNKKQTSLKGIQRMFFRTQLVLITSLALFLGIAGVLVNIQFESEKRDQNLQNVAETIANSPYIISGVIEEEDRTIISDYLDVLKNTLDDIDVISVVNAENIRIYHSNSSLIGSIYDGNLPNFDKHTSDYYVVDETGPSGKQRRAYAAIYNENGEYEGFVMVIMLSQNIKLETLQMLFIFLAITTVAILVELLIAGELSGKVKRSLMGYEPDVFTAMYKMRDNILETIEEGILAIDDKGYILFSNDTAIKMLVGEEGSNLIGKHIDTVGDEVLSHTLLKQNKERNVTISKDNIILDCVTIKEGSKITGTIAILHNRSEYIKLMEDLSGTRYLVDSMRANNHDFTNKLHVILGLIQMEMYEEACSYIQNITMVQRENISQVMKAVSEPAVAALLIGKIARASELNVKFLLHEGCCYSSSDMNLPTEMIITVVGNLLDNAFDSMNEGDSYKSHKELIFGIFSKPDAVLITVDDTGCGIKQEDMERIFEKGYSTKGKERGTGLWQVKTMVENFGGKITVETQEGIGSSFSVSFLKEDKHV